MKALEGIRILDLTHMVSGPYATLMLADSGAEIIKVEPSGRGENTRKLLSDDKNYSIDGMGAYFLTLARNKRSITLDLKEKKGMAIFHKLVKKADVVVYNFRSGEGEARGLSYERLKEVNKKIVCCSITGFGETGRHKDRVAFDLVAQGAGGGMFLCGGETPQRAGLPIGDLGAGLMACIGIQTALLARQKTLCGQQVDISMQDCQISLLNYMATSYFLSGKMPQPARNQHFAFVPYGCYMASDGYLIIAIVKDDAFKRLVDTLELKELSGSELESVKGRLEHREKINQAIDKKLASQKKEYWIDLLSKNNVPCGPVHSLKEAMEDLHLKDRNMIVKVPHPNGKKVSQVGNPIKLSDTYEDTFLPPPLLGQDNEDVYKGLLGFSLEEYSALKKEGII